MDETLTWTNHIKIIAKKIAKNIGVMRMIAHLISPKLRLNLYGVPYHDQPLIPIYPTGILYGHPAMNREFIALGLSPTILQKRIIRIIGGAVTTLPLIIGLRRLK